MTFRELLEALKYSKNKPNMDRPSSAGSDLIDRLYLLDEEAHKEWTNLELVKLFKDNGYRLDKEIPCKHCGGAKHRK